MTTQNLEKRADAPAAQAAAPQDETPTFLPHVDIIESEDGFEVIADMPGVDEKSVSVDLEKNVLKIRGTHAMPQLEGISLNYREFEYGNYERVFTLGDEIDREEVKATVRDGVLRLTLPRVKEAQPRMIKVHAG